MHVKPNWSNNYNRFLPPQYNVVYKTLIQYIKVECKVLQCLASPVCLITMWVKHSWYTRSVQYLISQQRLHDGTDAQTLYVSQESKTHFHGSYWSTEIVIVYQLCVGALHLCTKRTVVDEKRCSNILSVHSESNHGLNTSIVYIQGQWKTHHISDAPRLAFASMSHFKWKFDLACLHRISSSPF